MQYIFRGVYTDGRFEVDLVGIEAFEGISIIFILLEYLFNNFFRFVDPPDIGHYQVDYVWQNVPVPHSF